MVARRRLSVSFKPRPDYLSFILTCVVFFNTLYLIFSYSYSPIHLFSYKPLSCRSVDETTRSDFWQTMIDEVGIDWAQRPSGIFHLEEVSLEEGVIEGAIALYR